MDHMDLLEILNSIDPASLNYQEWLSCGMALKHEGYTAEDWDAWSSRDITRYHRGECARKWAGFRGSANPVTGGSIIQIATEHGWQKPLSMETGYALDWDDFISTDHVVVDKSWLEEREVEEPDHWDPASQLITYLETLFDTGEYVGFVTESYLNTKKNKWAPKKKGSFKRTAGRLIEALSQCKNDVGAVIGDWNKAAGAWIRFNPLDGEGVNDDNVTSYRYALVESDELTIGEQNAILRELELPIACLVHSGEKSLHAIVRIEAPDKNEYRKRVDFLYQICQKNGLKMDTQNKNPSRLSRMPGITRAGHKQFLVDTNIGKPSWNAWKEWIDSVNDNLPDPESLEDVWDHIPELSPCLIDGVLRQGHKMLIAGPSKAGKSFLQIELCIAIAEGCKWLNWDCAQGQVMYVNLELDRASCLHRFRDVYQAMGIPPNNLRNIDIWNLRGKSVPMDSLAPKLIRRAQKKKYIAIIIDPIYKVITGDENSADQMAKFCNNFDKVCTELGCSVIYCHHHSKGAQGSKRSMDRASGSGVFARDPDALLDLIELETTEDIIKQEENKAICRTCIQFLDTEGPSGWRGGVSDDDMLSSAQMLAYCRERLFTGKLRALETKIKETREAVKTLSAWRIEGTLREFPKFEPVNLWFRYPIHEVDTVGTLGDIQPETEKSPWQKGIEARKEQAKKASVKKFNEFQIEFDNLKEDGKDVSAQELAEKLEVSSKALCAWFGDGNKKRTDLKEHFEKYTGDDGMVYIRQKSV